jgi:hypothetical protein
MRKVIGWVLVALGTFLLCAGLLLRFYAADALKKTPLTVSSTTHLEGTADKLNPLKGEVENLDVKVTSVTKTDDEASDDDVVVFVNTTCVVLDEPDAPDCVDAGTKADPDKRLISATTDVFAEDRVTGLALSDEADDAYLPEGTDPHDGLINKWPFDAEKKDYPYWDDVLGEAVTAAYTGTETLEGLPVYVYEVDVEPTPAEVVTDIDGLYRAEKTIKVDPKTGSIVYQRNHDVRTLENGDPLIDLDVAFTDDQVKASVDEAADGGSKLHLISVIVPIVGVLVGLLLLAGGLFLVLRAPRTRQGD